MNTNQSKSCFYKIHGRERNTSREGFRTYSVGRFSIFHIVMLMTNKVHNQRLFYNFNTLRDYYDYYLYIQGLKSLLILNLIKE